MHQLRLASLFLIALTSALSLAAAPQVGRYRVFEGRITNDKAYENRFTDVELLVQYQAPSGRLFEFRGFFDGDGTGHGGPSLGNVWKFRFMPDEIGTWTYVYRWTDGTPPGHGTFECVAASAGKGILRPYTKNPHWFAYNGVQPVWLKSYYETGHGSLGQDFDWVVQNVYSPILARGYNHLQVNWLLSLCCFEQYYHDGPAQETTNLALYEEGKASTTMNLDAWQRMERHVSWLNDRDIGLHMFLGVEGGRNKGPAWEKLSASEKDFYVRYMVARLAPFANVAGWNFVWEVEGDRESHELGFARLVAKYDIFDHLRTYEDEFPRENHYALNEYNFAAVENHRIAGGTRDIERHLLRDAWTHHMACLAAYVGKPVFMSEGNSLWRRYWSQRVEATQDDLRRAAWACATAGASFTWNGHEGEESLVASGSEGLPFSESHPYAASARAIDILSHVMSTDVEFHKMEPHDELLAKQQVLRVYALAEPGQQYLVFAPAGDSFALRLPAGSYTQVIWIEANTGDRHPAPAITAVDEKSPVEFAPPHKNSDWVLVVRR